MEMILIRQKVDMETNLKEAQAPVADTKQLDMLGIGLFAVSAGFLLLAERVGFIPKDVSWGFPLLLIVFGGLAVLRSVRRK